MYNIHGHPRSGTHYLMAVLNANFIHKPSIWEVAWGHLRYEDKGRKVMAYPLHGLSNSFEENGLPHFYIWRKFDDVARSILRMPDRFGIQRKDLEITAGKLYLASSKVDHPKKGDNTTIIIVDLRKKSKD